MKKVLITGITGMIGSHLTDSLLEKGYSVTGIDDLSVAKMENIKHQLNNKNFFFEKIDVLDFSKLKSFLNEIGIIVHTGQHYDEKMSDLFFNELEISVPSYNLGIGSATYGEQTGKMIERIEKVLLKVKTDTVLLYGIANLALTETMS